MRDKSAGQGEATKSRVRNSAHVRTRVRVNTPRVVSALLGIFCARLPPLNSPIPPSLLFFRRILANDTLSPIDSLGQDYSTDFWLQVAEDRLSSNPFALSPPVRQRVSFGRVT